MAGVVLYALGDEAGHLARSIAYARGFLGARAPVTVLHSATAPVVEPPPPGVTLLPIAGSSSPAEVRDLIAAALGGGRRRELVVDTFPGGLGGEIDDTLLGLARRTTLIRRYVKPLAYEHYDALARRFDCTVIPYTPDRCEWPEEEISGSDPSPIFSGPLVRSLEVGLGPPATLAVFGSSSRLGPPFRRLLPRGTIFVAGPFRELPAARAYLSVGAGYNIAYELQRLGAPFALVPQERRYDDQFRRAELLGRSVHDSSGFESLLEEAA